MKCLLFTDIRQERSIVKSDFKQSTGVAPGDICDCHSQCKCGKPYGMAQTSSSLIRVKFIDTPNCTSFFCQSLGRGRHIIVIKTPDEVYVQRVIIASQIKSGLFN